MLTNLLKDSGVKWSYLSGGFTVLQLLLENFERKISR